MTYVALLFAVAFAFLIALFAVQNTMTVHVTLFKWNIETSLVLVILAAASLGFCTALFLQIYSQVKLRFQLYKAQSRIKQLEQELTQWQQPTALKQGDTVTAPEITDDRTKMTDNN